MQLILRSDRLHCRWINLVGRRDAELCEVSSRLLGALVRLRVLNSQPQHCRVRISRVEDAFNLAFELEEIVLAQCDFPDLQVDGLLNDRL